MEYEGLQIVKKSITPSFHHFKSAVVNLATMAQSATPSRKKL
jgi:hypothetical protein